MVVNFSGKVNLPFEMFVSLVIVELEFVGFLGVQESGFTVRAVKGTQ